MESEYLSVPQADFLGDPLGHMKSALRSTTPTLIVDRDNGEATLILGEDRQMFLPELSAAEASDVPEEALSEAHIQQRGTVEWLQ